MLQGGAQAAPQGGVTCDNPAQPPLKKRSLDDDSKPSSSGKFEECVAAGCQVSVPIELFELGSLQEVLNMDT